MIKIQKWLFMSTLLMCGQGLLALKSNPTRDLYSAVGSLGEKYNKEESYAKAKAAIANKADLNDKSDYVWFKNGILQLAILNRYKLPDGNEDIIKLLIDSGASVTTESLEYAIICGNANAIKLLIENGANPKNISRATIYEWLNDRMLKERLERDGLDSSPEAIAQRREEILDALGIRLKESEIREIASSPGAIRYISKNTRTIRAYKMTDRTKPWVVTVMAGDIHAQDATKYSELIKVSLKGNTDTTKTKGLIFDTGQGSRNIISVEKSDGSTFSKTFAAADLRDNVQIKISDNNIEIIPSEQVREPRKIDGVSVRAYKKDINSRKDKWCIKVTTASMDESPISEISFKKNTDNMPLKSLKVAPNEVSKISVFKDTCSGSPLFTQEINPPPSPSSQLEIGTTPETTQWVENGKREPGESNRKPIRAYKIDERDKKWCIRITTEKEEPISELTFKKNTSFMKGSLEVIPGTTNIVEIRRDTCDNAPIETFPVDIPNPMDKDANLEIGVDGVKYKPNGYGEPK